MFYKLSEQGSVLVCYLTCRTEKLEPYHQSIAYRFDYRSKRESAFAAIQSLAQMPRTSNKYTSIVHTIVLILVCDGDPQTVLCLQWSILINDKMLVDVILSLSISQQEKILILTLRLFNLVAEIVNHNLYTIRVDIRLPSSPPPLAYVGRHAPPRTLCMRPLWTCRTPPIPVCRSCSRLSTSALPTAHK